MADYITISISLTRPLQERLQRAADRQTISVSAVIRHALARYFLASDVTDDHDNGDELPRADSDQVAVGG